MAKSLKNVFNGNTVKLQYCVSFRCIAKWFGYFIYIYIYNMEFFSSAIWFFFIFLPRCWNSDCAHPSSEFSEYLYNTLNALSYRLLIFTSSRALSYSFFWIIFLCLLILSNCSVYFYVFSRSVMFPNFGEVAICRPCLVDHSSVFFSGHQNYTLVTSV